MNLKQVTQAYKFITKFLALTVTESRIHFLFVIMQVLRHRVKFPQHPQEAAEVQNQVMDRIAPRSRKDVVEKLCKKEIKLNFYPDGLVCILMMRKGI